jgi:hypothetical protein
METYLATFSRPDGRKFRGFRVRIGIRFRPREISPRGPNGRKFRLWRLRYGFLGFGRSRSRLLGHIWWRTPRVVAFGNNHLLPPTQCKCLSSLTSSVRRGSQENFAGSFPVFEQAMCFRSFRKIQNSIYLQPEPTFLDALYDFTCSVQQFLVSRNKIGKASTGNRYRPAHQSVG